MTERTITFPGNLSAAEVDAYVTDFKSHIRGTNDDGPETYPTPPLGWVCFHCGERFMTRFGAGLHFGSPFDRRPICASEDEVYRVALAINEAWNGCADVPFPLFQDEAEHLAEGAIKAIKQEAP